MPTERATNQPTLATVGRAQWGQQLSRSPALFEPRQMMLIAQQVAWRGVLYMSAPIEIRAAGMVDMHGESTTLRREKAAGLVSLLSKAEWRMERWRAAGGGCVFGEGTEGSRALK